MNEIIDKFKKADENNLLLSAYRPLPPETLKSLREYYRVGLTYTSNALEGNSLTESETKVDFIADRVIATQLDLLRLMREDDDTVNDTVNDTVKAVAPQLSKSEQTVLNAISLYPNYSYEKLATYCQLSRPTIARTIKALQSREFIRRIGSDKTGHWEVIKGKEDEV